MSAISQASLVGIASYVLFCFAVSSIVYAAIAKIISTSDFLSAIPLVTIIVYQTINFHHYVVDGIIWKVRKKKIREKLGVTT